MFYGDGGYYGDGDIEGAGVLDIAAPLVSEAVNAMDSEIIERKRGDTFPYVEEYLKDATGAAINLSDAEEVLYVQKDPRTGSVKASGACEFIDALGGGVRYKPGASDWSEGNKGYLVEFQITRENGTIFTVPTVGQRKMKIHDDLNG